MRRLFLLPVVLVAIGCGPRVNHSAIDRSIQEYDAGQWTIARLWARRAHAQDESGDASAWMLGLCEYRLGHRDEAAVWFTEAAQSNDPKIRADGLAMLEQMRASPPSSEPMASPVARSARFTLQFGAYRDQMNAAAAVEALTAELASTGLAAPRLSKDRDSVGRAIYLVQAGAFATRNAADARRQRGDLPRCIVTPRS